MKKMMVRGSLLFTLLASYMGFAQQGGGMWIPTELNEKEMKEMGLKISSKDIFSTGDKSINNAVAHFGGGCTSEVISPQGLLLTNHHCGYGQIQSHSSLENDYLADGFWAKELKDELPNKGLTATFIVDIKNVTKDILKGVKNEMTEEQREAIVKANIEKLNAATKKESFQETFIKPFYKGNEYYQFKTETFNDVRLVGAPPSSIGKYGNDTDNWVWPRHTGDFSMFRIYADKNNKPADYSVDNVPYTPKHHLPININGIAQDDFTFVYGFPGSTDEYLPSASLEQIKESLNPARINVRTIALSHIDKKMREDNATRIAYASKQARISNAHKKWIGENLGLNRSKAVEKRQQYETEFLKRIENNKNLKSQYGTIISDLNKVIKSNEDYNLAYNVYAETFSSNSETFRMAMALNNVVNAIGKPNYEEVKNRIVNQLAGMHKDYDAQLDALISSDLADNYFKVIPTNLLPETSANNIKTALNNSVVNGTKKINGQSIVGSIQELAKDDKAFIAALKEDALIQEINKVVVGTQAKITPSYLANNAQINKLMRTYMKGQMEVFKDKKIFPDANSTLRVTYGKVDGYQPRDAVKYEPITYLDGVIEKYVPGDYEFDLPKHMLHLYESQDYGNYKNATGKLPINFIATNHTTGGNSGSPALNAKGELIGLNFDRVWEGTMSDLNYDPEICRNIMVDARYILWVVDKYAGAQRLIDEMTIVK
ncbi:S46 family peptidase [Faecalibacter rhinopitheci]|uniref:Dipeptidyl-peptidase n=1 Tax=Faecalibacter rhinopitheci TaxID=2779678 RepID=A0A8J7G5Z9_9FLAO|nr:S46 family peptidase [Faecalibacter rhinopitheci]MBF0597362.1 S46 family peptidase [Faecalibacter rhinopitheci]